MTENIPDEIKAYPHWICWGAESKEGKETKIPYSPHGGMAKSDDPKTWGTFEQAKAYLEKNPNLSGLGFVFADDDPFCGIDLDKCRDPKTSVIEADAQKIVDNFTSYTEISPSGKGVHIIIEGKKKGARARKEKIEIYDSGRYFTMTGNVLNEHRKIENRQEQLDRLYDFLFAQEEKPRAPKQPKPNEVSLDDQTLIEKAKNAKDGAKFSALWEGDISGYPSHSEADLALCSLLAFWTGGDHDRIDGLFRQSGLYREKWNREDYQNLTIDTALEQVTEFYEPSGGSQSTAREVDLFQKKKTKEDFSPYFAKNTFIPKRLAFSTNQLPYSHDKTFAYYRRWVIIPFPHQFTGKRDDKSLKYKLTKPDELSGLLNRALAGLNRLFENQTFSDSATVRDAIEDYKKQNDTVAAFVAIWRLRFD